MANFGLFVNFIAIAMLALAIAPPDDGCPGGCSTWTKLGK
ncbi:uncharacterized protein LOC119554716 [Drosophila subpulchrella]|nr:uncharacterized protein LOC119554716 [Drosophila subpulchrella]